MKTYLFYRSKCEVLTGQASEGRGSTNAPYEMKIWKVLHLLKSSEIVMDIAKIILNHLISFKEIFNTIKVGKYFNTEIVEYNVVMCATENNTCEITPTFQRFNSYLSKETERMMRELFFDLDYFVVHQYNDMKLVDSEDSEVFEADVHYGCLISKTDEIEEMRINGVCRNDSIYYHYGIFNGNQLFLSFGRINDGSDEVDFTREYTLADFRRNYKGSINQALSDSEFILALKKQTLELGYEICSEFGFCCINP
jgi:hypothetical protein